MKIVRVALSGLGSVHQNVLSLLASRRSKLAERHGLELRIVWVADSSGIRSLPAGFDPESLASFKQRGGRLAELEEGQSIAGPSSEPEPRALDALATSDLLFEATPVDLETGGFGLRIVQGALKRGLHVVLANKGPLVRDYAGVMRLAEDAGRSVGFSATVCGGLPVVNIGRRDFPLADISSLRGIFNSTTNFMLEQMRHGRSYGSALEEAQRRGIAETNPDFDVLGYDTAAKLVILANSVLGTASRLEDVSIQGIQDLPATDSAAKPDEMLTKLVASATSTADGYRLSVAPTRVEPHSFLGGCSGWEMGVELETDIYGHQFFKIWEREPVPTAAAMLRDAVILLSSEHDAIPRGPGT